MNKNSDKHNMTDFQFNMVKNLAYEKAFSGDQSFAELALHCLRRKLIDLEPFDLADIGTLLWIIDRVAASKQGINIICGVENEKGRPRTGRNNLQIAIGVYGKIRIEKLTAEEAWEVVAKEVNKSPYTVKKYWIKYKDILDEAVIHYVDESEKADTKNPSKTI